MSLRRVVRAVVVVVVLVASLAVAPPGGAPDAAAQTTDPAILRPSRLSAGQLAAWYRARTPVAYRATVPLGDLTRYFIEEGRDEGVSGDIAFAQSVLETGWFGFQGRVPPSANNFAGIGATDATSDYAVFPTARIGVRAQIQHLRAYGDPTVTVANLAHPLVDPRFDLVQPKGKAPRWSMLGGLWASDPAYGYKIIALYQDLLAFSQVSSFPDVPVGSYYAAAVAWMEHSRITDGVGTTGLFVPLNRTNRAEVATMLWRMLGRPTGAPPSGFPDVPRDSYYALAVDHLRAIGVTDGVGTTGLFVPTRTVTRAEMVTFIWRLAGSPAVPTRHPFPDVPTASYYDRAVSWAYLHGITDGVGTTGLFQPMGPVLRAQVATFLHRLVLRPAAWLTPLPPTAP